MPEGEPPHGDGHAAKRRAHAAAATMSSGGRGKDSLVTPTQHWLAGAAVVAVVIYATMWVGFAQNWSWLEAIDHRWLQFFHDFGVTRPDWVSFWVVFCLVFGPSGFQVIAAPLIAVALLRRDVRTALFLVVSVELSGVVASIAKGLGDRPRPATALVHGVSTSFPSGHAVCVMVGVLAVLTVSRTVIPTRLQLLAVVVGGALIFLVGFARLVLNVHNPSDIVAGWALGFVYYLTCLRFVPPRSLRSPEERPRPETGASTPPTQLTRDRTRPRPTRATTGDRRRKRRPFAHRADVCAGVAVRHRAASMLSGLTIPSWWASIP
jgi:membrane-associated phospholipid phosphatase